MKKFLALILALSMMFALCACGGNEAKQTEPAEESNSQNVEATNGVDLSKFSDEELIALNKMVQQEIVNRSIEKSATIIHGTYYVGKDIPAGSYVFNAKAGSDDSIIFYVYADDAHRASDDHRYYEYVGRGEENSWAISLDEGEVFTFGSGEITLTVSAGIKFN